MCLLAADAFEVEKSRCRELLLQLIEQAVEDGTFADWADHGRQREPVARPNRVGAEVVQWVQEQAMLEGPLPVPSLLLRSPHRPRIEGFRRGWLGIAKDALGSCK